MLKIYENFDLIHIIIFRFNLGLNVNFCFSICWWRWWRDFLFWRRRFFDALDQFYLLNNV